MNAMASIETNPVIPPQVMADLEEVCRQVAGGGIVRDPELVRRIEERADKARQELLRRVGVQDIGGEIIREMLDSRLCPKPFMPFSSMTFSRLHSPSISP